MLSFRSLNEHSLSLCLFFVFSSAYGFQRHIGWPDRLWSCNGIIFLSSKLSSYCCHPTSCSEMKFQGVLILVLLFHICSRKIVWSIGYRMNIWVWFIKGQKYKSWDGLKIWEAVRFYQPCTSRTWGGCGAGCTTAVHFDNGRLVFDPKKCQLMVDWIYFCKLQYQIFSNTFELHAV